MQNIHQKQKANENTRRHNPKKKTKANNPQNKIESDKDPMQRGLMTTKRQSMITKKTFGVCKG